MALERDQILDELKSTKAKAEELARLRNEEAEERQVERALREKAEAQKRQLEAKLENMGKAMIGDSFPCYLLIPPTLPHLFSRSYLVRAG